MRNLTDEEIELLTDKAAEKAAKKVVNDFTQQVYVEIGKAVLHKLAWCLGALLVGTVIWLHANGWLK